MKLSHDDLVTLLSDTLKTDQEKAEKALSDWVQSVKTEISEKGESHVTGLGTFIEKDGHLTFIPDEELAVEVNYKYAGMKPIEIMSSLMGRQKEEEEHEKEQGATDEEQPEAPIEGVSEAKSTGADEKEKKAEPSFDIDDNLETGGKEAASDLPEEAEDIFTQDPFEEAVSGAKKRHEETKTAPATTEKAKKSRKKPPAKRRQSRIWMLPIAAAILLAGLLYLHVETNVLDRFFISEERAYQETIPLPPAGEPSALPEEPPEHFLSETEEVTPELPFGLKGPEEEVLIGAYTIVLHSITNENRARIEKEKLMEEGYKATLWKSQLGNGRTTWRVGVGQFEDISVAERAISELPEPYRSNNFIIRIR